MSGYRFPRFECPACGREVASVYRDAIHAARDQHYAYLRPDRTPDGFPCPARSTGPLATALRRR